jgi:hypothetical protein
MSTDLSLSSLLAWYTRKGPRPSFSQEFIAASPRGEQKGEVWIESVEMAEGVTDVKKLSTIVDGGTGTAAVCFSCTDPVTGLRHVVALFLEVDANGRVARLFEMSERIVQ